MPIRLPFHWSFVAVATVMPAIDLLLPPSLRLADLLRPIFIFAILGLGLNIVTGLAGLLNLGIAAFMAIGAYSYGILTCDIYPFQLGFWSAVSCTVLIGAIAGLLIGLPTIRLRGDYVAIVTLGFGEITQDALKNLDTVSKGTQGLNPLPGPTFFGHAFEIGNYLPSYYLYLAVLTLAIAINRNLELSRVGRNLMSLREDELAASCMGLHPVHVKMVAFAFGASFAALAGALWASYLGSTGEPGNYDFQLSIIALCIVIVGGLGSINGVLVGALVMIGFNSIFLVKLTGFLTSQGLISGSSIFSSPNNYKALIFGLALVLMMRLKPGGLMPSGKVRRELSA